jgi:hypothetical protein
MTATITRRVAVRVGSAAGGEHASPIPDRVPRHVLQLESVALFAAALYIDADFGLLALALLWPTLFAGVGLEFNDTHLHRV